MKKYIEIQIDVFYMGEMDIITYSLGKDNDYDDEVWFEG